MQEKNPTPEMLDADESQPEEKLTETPPVADPPAADIDATDAVQERKVDTMPSLQEALRAAELQASEHHDAWLRAKAEAENVRRRAQEDIAKASKYAAEKFARALLPVKDSLEAALRRTAQRKICATASN